MMKIKLVSFGYKYGTPRKLNMIFDVRFLKNPFFVKRLSGFSGNHKSVYSYVLKHEDAKKFITRISSLLNFLTPLYEKKKRKELSIGVGCTGGKHRSVTIANSLAKRIKHKNLIVEVRHRDLGKE